MYALARPFLFALDPERAHDFALSALRTAWQLGLNPLLARRPAACPVDLLGIRFENPVGLAAGLDKNGDYFEALAALGFGFVEIGTITPKPQPGNPRPRMFRLPEAGAVINRMGFNNKGVAHLVKRVECSNFKGVLGINIGKNKDTPNERALDDYLYCLERVHPLAHYVTVNISSPNTQGLRDLQQEDALRTLLGGLRERAAQLDSKHARRVPLLVKIAPDLDETGLDAIANVVAETAIDGIIATNTTISRESVRGVAHAVEAGGLSGAPVREPSNRVLGELRRRLPTLPLIGVGGISEGAHAVEKHALGANLVQCYTGFIYRGPALIAESVEAWRTAMSGSTA
jgi:dihydroorotate dehydrogenase